jgi:two-component system cell cycle response regulator
MIPVNSIPPQSQASSGPGAERPAARVVVADDSMSVRAVLRHQLTAQGYLVLEAEDGGVALRVCRESSPDVALLDIEMPVLDGREVLRALKSDPATADLPVVFITGRTTTEDVVAGLRLGAHDYLKKPFEPAELLARVSAAVRMKRLQDELRQRNTDLDTLSRTDALTGLNNRRHAEELLSEYSPTGRRAGTSLAVLMFDLDHFKAVNDTFGHAGGDIVLREFATGLRAALRNHDVASRWGGEEFLVLLPGCGMDEATLVGERIRSAAARPVAVDAQRSCPVTVSGGCAAGVDIEPEELIRRADRALYLAKEQGRNRLVAADLIS